MPMFKVILEERITFEPVTLKAIDAEDAEAKVSLVAGVSKDTMSKVKAGELVNFVATQIGGKGGGKPDLAQAGGTNPAALAGALAGVSAWVQERLGA